VCACLRGARHHQLHLLPARTSRENADDPTAVHHCDPVGQPEHLVEFGRHEHHSGASVPLGDHSSVDELLSTDIHATGGL
jgi:hypothetical protein